MRRKRYRHNRNNNNSNNHLYHAAKRQGYSDAKNGRCYNDHVSFLQELGGLFFKDTERKNKAVKKGVAAGHRKRANQITRKNDLGRYGLSKRPR